MDNKFSIRFAKREDTELILKFIKELADYEKLLHEVTADKETLENSLFDKEMAEVIIGEYDGKAVGFALFFHNFSTFLGKAGIYLEDLYVRPEFRGRGFGKKLLSFLAELTVKRDCGRLEWWVLDWNKDSIDFYESLEAKAMDEWTVYRLTGSPLKKLAEEE